MELKSKIQIVSFNNEAWSEIKANLSRIGEFLSGGEKNEKIARLMNLSARLIASEFLINPDEYKKYPTVEYSDEDFVDMVIEAITQKVPDIDDTNANEQYIEDIRLIIWSHIKVYAKRLGELLQIMAGDIEGYDAITDDDIQILMDCLTVAWVECILRNRESSMLEHHYGT